MPPIYEFVLLLKCLTLVIIVKKFFDEVYHCMLWKGLLNQAKFTLIVQNKRTYDSFYYELEHGEALSNFFELNQEHATCEELSLSRKMKSISCEAWLPNAL